MSDPLQRRLLERELEFMCFFGRGIAGDLARTEGPENALTLVRGLLAVSLKISRLLWPYGRRAGDELGAREAAELRKELGIYEDHLLAPGQTGALAAALRLTSEELLAALSSDRTAVHTNGGAVRLGEIESALTAIHRALTAAQQPAA